MWYNVRTQLLVCSMHAILISPVLLFCWVSLPMQEQAACRLLNSMGQDVPWSSAYTALLGSGDRNLQQVQRNKRRDRSQFTLSSRTLHLITGVLVLKAGPCLQQASQAAWACNLCGSHTCVAHLCQRASLYLVACPQQIEVRLFLETARVLGSA